MEIFERTSQRESWPEDHWAHILAPFLTGPAQQASQDLTPDQASQYPILKQAILAILAMIRFASWRTGRSPSS